jgi:hypothetical protein
MDTWEFELGGWVVVSAGAETAGHVKVDLTEITDFVEMKEDCGGFPGVGEEPSGTARGLERAVEPPDGL